MHSLIFAQVAADVAQKPPQFWEMVLQYVVAPGLAIVGPLLIAALAKLVSYLGAKATESKTANVAFVFAELANSVVVDLEKNVRPQLQRALADGRLSPEEGAELKAAAMKTLKEKAPSGLLMAAQKAFGPIFETWLGGLVERANAASNPK